MGRWLPPAGWGYSGREPTSGRPVAGETPNARTVKASKSGEVDSRSAVAGKVIKVPPKGSAGVSRAV